MVKKYFRPFICAVCAVMSVICGAAPVFDVYASVVDASDAETDVALQDIAAEEEEETEKQTEKETEKESEKQTETESEKQTEKQTEKESEPESEKQTETEAETEKETESESEKESETETETEKHDLSNALLVTMKQASDTVSPVDEIRQTVSVAYKDAVDSKIDYTVDPSLDVKSIEVGANTYLEGGKALITSDAGESEIGITASMDLSSYVNITKIVFIPKIRSYSGMEAKFTTVMKLKEKAVSNGVSKVSCKTGVTASLEESSADFSTSLDTEIKSANIEKPVLSLVYDGKEYGDKESVSGAIEFDKEFVLNLSSLGMEAYGKTDKFVYSVTVPSFVTLKEIQVPALSGASKVNVFATIAETDTNLGEVAPESIIKVEKNGVTEVRFEIVPEESVISTSTSGKLVFLNDRKENKGINNASFAANAKSTINETDYSSNSSIISVNIKSRTIEEPETQPPQTNSGNSGNSGGNGGGNGGNSGGNTPSQTEPQTEPETENPNDVARKQEESERKEKVKKEALQNEQELKNKQANILAARLSKLKAQSGATGSESTATVTKKKPSASSAVEKRYANWKVKPIDESIIENLIQKEITPISEGMIENLVPGGKNIEKGNERAADRKMVQTEEQ